MEQQVFIHTRLSRAYLALARLSCYLCILRTVTWPYRWTDYDARWLIGRVFYQGNASWGVAMKENNV